ncbi:MAG: FkbM family methyltransferase [Pseudomonadota bacterium]
MSGRTTRSQNTERLARVIDHHAISLVFDVGANEGQYGDRVRDAGYGGRIISFEPLSETHRLLADHAAGDDNWIIAPPMALAERDGETEINVSAQTGMSSLRGFTEEMADLLDSARFVSTERVRLARLDSVIDDFATPDDRGLLKIDTQGTEDLVLAGAVQSLKRIALIQIELSIVPVYKGTRGFTEMIGHLAGLGFEPVLFLPGYFNRRTARLIEMDGVFARRDATP